jgi:hypothetical protein
MARFKLGNDDQIEHGCCYGAVVVDTTKPVMIGDKHYNNQYERVCECFDEKDGQMIADALNAYLEKNND